MKGYGYNGIHASEMYVMKIKSQTQISIPLASLDFGQYGYRVGSTE